MPMGLIESLRLKGGTKSFHRALFLCCKELFGLSQDEFAARWRPRDESSRGTLRGYIQPTSDALFDEWRLRRDADWLYSHPEYKWDSLGVSTFQTSVTTTSGVSLLNKAGFVPNMIFDWGAGPGFSSMIMARNFPRAEVHYNEINPDLTRIFEWFSRHAGIKNVHVVSAPAGSYDLVQAYEIAEHIPHPDRPGVGDPITATLDVLKHTVERAAFLHSSCWSAENRYTTLGHFLRYEIGGQLIKNTRAGMHFRRILAGEGWTEAGAGWNSRPFLFLKGG